jgi:hypothetical protein
VPLLSGLHVDLQSVYLQQVGIIVFMAHIGCFVPAAYAEIGMVDRIIARTNQDGDLMESFAADLVCHRHDAWNMRDIRTLDRAHYMTNNHRYT